MLCMWRILFKHFYSMIVCLTKTKIIEILQCYYGIFLPFNSITEMSKRMKVDKNKSVFIFDLLVK